ncbi:hypothetical protein FACS189450_06010 [Spirochaetia bacterium]|nr:hypothetical protein FACS189450_06010 [Spirochaetia bacterium]
MFLNSYSVRITVFFNFHLIHGVNTLVLVTQGGGMGVCTPQEKGVPEDRLAGWRQGEGAATKLPIPLLNLYLRNPNFILY